VLVVGGHANMGGAVIMAAEAAFHAGAGKVTVICDASHHSAILSRAPNIMVQDIDQFDQEKLKHYFVRSMPFVLEWAWGEMISQRRFFSDGLKS
jgi:NAD(P)H-hydrate repair Nnr-like enzyme with NAD(P)H-hydrate dehydratase domain